MNRLIIGIPTRGNDISSGVFEFVHRILLTRDDWHTFVALGECNVSAALAVESLWNVLREKLGQFDYYLQIDADVTPPPNALDSMVAKDKDIVVVPIWHYDSFGKDIHINVHQNNLRQRMYGIRIGGCDKIYASSLGCVLMKHKVIETFINAKEDPIRWSPLLGEHTGKDIHNDNIFFAKADKLGLEVWVDWDVKNVVHRQRVDLSTEVLSRLIEHLQVTGKTGDKG